MSHPPAQPILVLGHRNPDTDAICSALAYADLYHWQTGRPTVACHLDELAPETAWLLRHLGLEAPRPVQDVYLRVADVMETAIPRLRPEQTLREAGLLMQTHHLRALPVVDEHHRFVGLVQYETLAALYLEQLQLPEVIDDLPLTVLQRTLDAELLSGSPETRLQDRVWMATMTSATARTCFGKGDIVIVGDQYNVQQTGINARVGALILTDNAPVDAFVLQRAIEHNVVLLRTPHSTFATALLLQQSVPVQRVMMQDMVGITVQHDTLLNEAKAQLRRSNVSALAVVDDAGLWCGMLLRRHLTEQTYQTLILTDHNHPDQAAPGVSESQIIAIIDHHNLGGLQTLQPLVVHCEPVGSTCTLIAEQYQQHGAPLSPALAGAMLGALLSDTVQLRSPTTTPRDHAIAAWLETQSGQSIPELARSLFRARLPEPIPPASWWVSRDMKTYTFGDTRMSISQMELAHVRDVMPPADELRAALRDLQSSQGLTSAFLLLTDIITQGSLLLAATPEDEALAERAFGRTRSNGCLDLPGVVSRKQQVLPPLAAALTS